MSRKEGGVKPCCEYTQHYDMFVEGSGCVNGILAKTNYFVTDG